MLILGTANFTNKYNGTTAQDPFLILDYAYDRGIRMYDVADAYNFNLCDWKHINDVKVVVKISTLKEYSYAMMNYPNIHAILIHQPRHLYEGTFEKLKEVNISKTGASLYYQFEVEEAINKGAEIVQIPFSIFNRQKIDYGIEVHIRSIYSINRVWQAEAIKNLGVNYTTACMAWAKQCENIVIGVDSIEQLKHNIDEYEKPYDKELVERLKWLQR